jgi:WD40 repeat protein
VAFSPADSKRILSCSEDKTVRLWNAETGEELKRLQGHDRGVLAVVFSADGKRALSCGWDKTAKKRRSSGVILMAHRAPNSSFSQLVDVAAVQRTITAYNAKLQCSASPVSSCRHLGMELIGATVLGGKQAAAFFLG